MHDVGDNLGKLISDPGMFCSACVRWNAWCCAPHRVFQGARISASQTDTMRTCSLQKGNGCTTSHYNCEPANRQLGSRMVKVFSASR